MAAASLAEEEANSSLEGYDCPVRFSNLLQYAMYVVL
jgi:hypothetical protein